MIDAIKDFFYKLWESSILFFTDFFDKVSVFIDNFWLFFIAIISLIIGYFIFRVLKLLTVPGIILGEIVMLSVIITSMLALVSLMSLSLVAIYNRIFELGNFITSNFSSFDCFAYISDCMGITTPMSYFYTEVFAIITTVLLIKSSFLFLWALNFISEKIWRIGVLIGLV